MFSIKTTDIKNSQDVKMAWCQHSDVEKKNYFGEEHCEEFG